MAFERIKNRLGVTNRRSPDLDDLETMIRRLTDRSLRKLRDAMNFQSERIIDALSARWPVLKASHHSIFRKFGPTAGEAPAGYHREYGGNIISEEIWQHDWPPSNDGYPAYNEELFEWIDLLESIDDAADRYLMVELGAGFGRWSGAAAYLLRQYKPMPFRLITSRRTNSFRMDEKVFLG